MARAFRAPRRTVRIGARTEERRDIENTWAMLDQRHGLSVQWFPEGVWELSLRGREVVLYADDSHAEGEFTISVQDERPFEDWIYRRTPPLGASPVRRYIETITAAPRARRARLSPSRETELGVGDLRSSP